MGGAGGAISWGQTGGSQSATPPMQAGGRTGVEGPGLTRGQRIAYGLLILLRYTWSRAGSVVARAAVRCCRINEKVRWSAE